MRMGSDVAVATVTHHIWWCGVANATYQWRIYRFSCQCVIFAVALGLAVTSADSLYFCPRRRDKNVFESKQYAGAATVAYVYLSQSGQLRIILYLALIKENSDSDGNREQGTELTAQENERERRQPRITKRRCPTPKSGRCIN
jgi:hypothetical protein